MSAHSLAIQTPIAEKKRQRLSADDWVRTAMDALVEHGIEGVRIDQLARKLGVTKGSFYAHFRGREDLLDAMAHFWADIEPATVIDEVSALPGDPKTKLMLLGAVYQRENLPAVDRAMRAWALTDPRAARAVAKAHDRIEALMVTFYEEMGFNRDEAAFRVRIQLMCAIGMLFAVEYFDKVPTEDELQREGERFLEFLTGPARPVSTEPWQCP